MFVFMTRNVQVRHVDLRHEDMMLVTDPEQRAAVAHVVHAPKDSAGGEGALQD